MRWRDLKVQIRTRIPATVSGIQAGIRIVQRLRGKECRSNKKRNEPDGKEPTGKMQRPPEELVYLVLKQAGGGDDRHDGTDLVKGRACSDDIEREHDALGPRTWRIVREVQWLQPTHKVARWDQ